MPIYTAVSFAPVQGFIEKSRKLRDLYGASLILSFLSQKIAKEAEKDERKVISPASINVQEGMPNRILVKGLFERNDVEKILTQSWQSILETCRLWMVNNLGIAEQDYHWDQEWLRWKQYTWEVFWGTGETPDTAMRDLERRKLKRDWIGINWIGESSSLTGTDAIAWNRLGEEHREPGRSVTEKEKDELELFYRRLSWLLDDPDRRAREPSLSLEELRHKQSKPDEIGKYVAPNERLSLPELVKRLVTYEKIADEIDMDKLKKHKDRPQLKNIIADDNSLQKLKDEPEFKDILREAGYWTGWFMGDGDKVGDKLKQLAERNINNELNRDKDLKCFSELMRDWGKKFKDEKDLFTEGKGRVIYAGGDDFLGVIYSEETKKPDKSEVSEVLQKHHREAESVKPTEALEWLLKLPKQWTNLQTNLKQELKLGFTYSVGFVWAGHSVPQRDVLQHCREAEKRAKSLGRDRVTIRVVFNSGQYVQWTCPWSYLNILTKYIDRNGKTGKDEKQNWNHIYSDWAQLKARHAVRLQKMETIAINKQIALSLFDLYFANAGQRFEQERKWEELTGDNTDFAIVNWIDDLIQVGWQLCRNSKP